MKKSLAFLLIAIFLFTNAAGAGPAFAASESPFTDVPQDSPYYQAIENLRVLGIINGYPDGTFKPGNTVNRAEAVKMIMNSAKMYPSAGLYYTGFPDVPIDAWYAKYVLYGFSLSIIGGNPDGTFAPGRAVNKAEFVKMLLKTFKADLSQHQNLSQVLSADTTTDAWYAPYFSYARTTGLIYPNLKNELEPEKFLTRAECAEIIYKMYTLYFGGETQKLLDIAEANIVDALVQIGADNLESALADANEAVFYSTEALNKDPDLNVTKAANKIALAFQKLFRAYSAGLLKDYGQMTTLVAEAKTLAGEAALSDISVQPLADKVMELGDTLLAQADV